MSAHDRQLFVSKIMRYKDAYKRDNDATRYFASAAVAAAQVCLSERNEILRKQGKVQVALPTALTVASPLLMAAIDSVADVLSCPIEGDMSALEFLQHFREHVDFRYNSEYMRPVKNALDTVRSALRSVGI